MTDRQRQCGSCSRTISENNPKSGKLYGRCERCRTGRKARNESNRAKGRCRDCRAPAHGKARCLECSRRLKARLRGTGKCQNCGHKLTQTGSICRICALKGVTQKQLGDRARWIELEQLLTSQGDRCALSGLPIDTGKGASLDHIVPSARGGTDELGNLRFAHLVANRMKGSLRDEEFLAWIEILAWHARKQGLLPQTLRPPSQATISLALSVGGRPKGEAAAYGTYRRSSPPPSAFKRCGGPS